MKQHVVESKVVVFKKPAKLYCQHKAFQDDLGKQLEAIQYFLLKYTYDNTNMFILVFTRLLKSLALPVTPS